MSQLKVAVICRQKGHAELRAKLGWWSYPVPEFRWLLCPQSDGFAINTADLQLAGCHVIVHEDWVRGELVGHHLPCFYSVVDSNTSARRLEQYRAYAHRQADVVLLDQDDPAQWAGLDLSVHHWPYAVNETVFKPGPKTVDVACHVERTPARQALVGRLAEWGQHQPYHIALSNGLSSADYAAALGRAKIVVHLSTHPPCRSHRVFDALAAGACLLTSPLPDTGDGFRPGTHYLEWHDFAELTHLIDDLLTTGAWQMTAEQGRAFVLERHTWRIRATELNAIMRREYRCLSSV